MAYSVELKDQQHMGLAEKRQPFSSTVILTVLISHLCVV